MDTDTPTLDHANDSIAADWARISGGETVDTPDAGKTEAATFDAHTGEDVTKGPARDATGKFAPKAPAATDVPAEIPQEDAAALAGDPEAAQTDTPAYESPKSMRKELAEKHWGKLDPEVQAAWTARDADYERGIARYRERSEAADRMDAVFAPYQETLQQVGATPEVAVQTLLGMDHILRHGQPNEKAALIAQLANQFNVPLEHLPQVSPLQQQLLAQAQQLHAHQAQQTAAQAQQAQRELDTLTSEVIRFSEGKEHFGVVQQEMFAVLPSINQQFPNATPQEKLQKAYDIAINANPTARDAIAAQRQQAQRQEALKKAAEAKRAASVNRSPRGVVAPAAAIGSMDDTIRAKAAELGLA